MKTILMITDGSSASHAAAKIALDTAAKTGANLMLAAIHTIQKQPVNEYIMAASSPEGNEASYNLFDDLALINERQPDFEPDIQLLPPLTDTSADLVAMIIKNDTCMIVKGFTEQVSAATDVQAILTKVNCPLLLVPESYKEISFRRSYIQLTSGIAGSLYFDTWYNWSGPAMQILLLPIFPLMECRTWTIPMLIPYSQQATAPKLLLKTFIVKTLRKGTPIRPSKCLLTAYKRTLSWKIIVSILRRSWAGILTTSYLRRSPFLYWFFLSDRVIGIKKTGYTKNIVL